MRVPFFLGHPVYSLNKNQASWQISAVVADGLTAPSGVRNEVCSFPSAILFRVHLAKDEAWKIDHNKLQNRKGGSL